MHATNMQSPRTYVHTHTYVYPSCSQVVIVVLVLVVVVVVVAEPIIIIYLSTSLCLCTMIERANKLLVLAIECEEVNVWTENTRDHSKTTVNNNRTSLT